VCACVCVSTLSPNFYLLKTIAVVVVARERTELTGDPAAAAAAIVRCSLQGGREELKQGPTNRGGARCTLLSVPSNPSQCDPVEKCAIVSPPPRLNPALFLFHASDFFSAVV